MNGFISTKAVRYNLLASLCLLTGFVSGSRMPSVADFFLKNTEIRFDKISWIQSAVKPEGILLASVDYPKSTIEDHDITLADFKLESSNLAMKKAAFNKKTVSQNWNKLETAMNLLERNLFEDYQWAHQQLRHEMKMAFLREKALKETIIIAKSSAVVPQSKTLPPPKVIHRHVIKSVPKKLVKRKSRPKTEYLKQAIIETPHQNPVMAPQPLLDQVVTTKSSAEEPIQPTSEVVVSESLVTSVDPKSLKVTFIKPDEATGSENSQTLPARQRWISKSWGDLGWSKFDFNGFYSLLTYYPNQNLNQLMVLDQNALAMIALKAGVHLSRETGMVMGNVPPGYRVEYSGRSEEVEYFDIHQQRYFIVLNAEPGAGVIDLISDLKTTEKASVFAPVMKETITFLDLAEPIQLSIPIRISKKTSQKADLEGLTVSLSTETSKSTLTDQEGKAVLEQVSLIPGYPVFLDVNAKFNGKPSYQYRYHLSKRNKQGEFLLKQVPEKVMYRWIRSTQQTIETSSGMILGEFSHKSIKGFKKFHFAKVKNLVNDSQNLAKTFSVLWNEKISEKDPLEGDRPRFLSVNVQEGLSQAVITDDESNLKYVDLIPVSPRVISVISE